MISILLVVAIIRVMVIIVHVIQVSMGIKHVRVIVNVMDILLVCVIIL